MKSVYRAEFNGNNITKEKWPSVSRAIREAMESLLKNGKYNTLSEIDKLVLKCIRREEINQVVMEVANKHEVNLWEMVNNTCKTIYSEDKEPLLRQFDYARTYFTSIEGFSMELITVALIQHCSKSFRDNPTTVSSVSLINTDTQDIFTLKKYEEPEELKDLSTEQRLYLENGIRGLLKDVLPGKAPSILIDEDWFKVSLKDSE